MMSKISTVFIANRGEIASRIIETVHRMGMRAVGVYIEQEKNALYVQQLDEAKRLSGFSLQAFLDSDDLLGHAKAMHADAIHPGYGFLSENASFAKACKDNDFIWIGPDAKVIETLGDKQQAKAIAEKCKVPVLQSIAEQEKNDTTFEQKIKTLPLPIMLKPMMGGGGKGMTVVRDYATLQEDIAQARSIAQNAFNDSRLLAEPFLEKPKHVEIQMLRDAHGNASFLWERDCTIQRRHQKVIEESPSILMNDTQRESLKTYAIDILHEVEYTNAGTVEFIIDNQSNVYFMEVNTRLQVEHPVTEMILGIDLVEAQIRVAQEEVVQIEATPKGHALEVRIYAENADQDFLPSTGRIQHLSMPEEHANLRLDMGVQTGTNVSSFFDPMLMKITVLAHTREEAIMRMQEALHTMALVGVQTNQSYVSWVLTTEDFQQGAHHTQWTSQTLDHYKAQRNQKLAHVVPAWENVFSARYQTDTMDPWVSGETKHSSYASLYQWNQAALPVAQDLLQSQEDVDVYDFHNQDWIFFGADVFVFQKIKHHAGKTDAEKAVFSPMTGTITNIHVIPGDAVQKDDVLIEMEAMKMQYKLRAPSSGIISQICCDISDVVQGDMLLIDMDIA